MGNSTRNRHQGQERSGELDRSVSGPRWPYRDKVTYNLLKRCSAAKIIETVTKLF